MKKLILVMMSLLVCQMAFAQTDVIVSPVYPTTCQDKDQRRLVNWIFDMENIAENEESATFQYKTMSGACIDGKPAPSAINAAMTSVLLWRKGESSLFSKDPYVITKAQADATTVEVTITFNKKKLFKNGAKSRDLSLQYFPRGSMSARAFYFPWRLKLIKHDEFETQFMIQ